MKILFLSSGDRVPSSRFRMLPYVDHFRAAGHQCTLASSLPQKYDWYKAIGFRLSQRLKQSIRYLHWRQSRWRGDEIVVIDREIFDSPSFAAEERFRRTAPRLVLDLDDGVFLRYPEKFERLAEMADLILCGNSFIEEWAKQRCSRTIILPTCVRMRDYAAKDWSGADSRPPRIGWIGTTGNLTYLQVATPALRQLATQTDFEFRVIVPDAAPLKDIDLAGVRVVHEPWDKAREVDQLRELDIGLMPLFPDQEWDKYKCGLKLIQYMAIGIPAIASPVGVNSSIVRHSKDGFLANSDATWLEALQQLCHQRDDCQSIGANARETVRERYSIEANFPRYEQALRNLLDAE